MPEQFTDGEWMNAGEFMNGQIAVIVGDPSTPAWEWEVIASVLFEADDEARGEGAITREQAMAHADLIAASKKLFKACEKCERLLLQRGDPWDGDDWQAMQDVRAAIAKARGELERPEDTKTV